MLKIIRFNLKQILAITEKEVKQALRYKFSLAMSIINPFIALIFPLILMQQFFSFQANFGPWNAQNYLIYLFVGYNVLMLQGIIGTIGSKFKTEKYWGTLQALMIAPFNRYNLLFGLILSHTIQISIPFLVFLIICYVFFPISIFTIILLIILFLAVLVIFAGISLFIGVFSISKESVATWLTTILRFVFLFSCISYPYQLFPEYIQIIVLLNPIYYIIDIVRLTWIENDLIYTLLNHPYHFLILLILLFSMPFIGIYMFNYIFKRYGIEGY